METAGYRTSFATHAFADEGYLAGTDTERAADLMEAFLDPRVDGVWCSRGGYGCARLLPYLDLNAIAHSGKPLIGFSDVTTLSLALARRGVPSLYAPMAITFSVPRERAVIDSFLNALAGGDPLPECGGLGTCVVGGSAKGLSAGGCLCLLTDSLGTAERFEPGGKIVFLEDVDEAPHRIDAMLTHLIAEGSIRRAAGIVVGEMTRSDQKTDGDIGGRPWRDIVIERLAPLGLPMILDFPFGHFKSMRTIPMGEPVYLDADEARVVFPLRKASEPSQGLAASEN